MEVQQKELILWFECGGHRRRFRLALGPGRALVVASSSSEDDTLSSETSYRYLHMSPIDELVICCVVSANDEGRNF
jgi:hypothetical protein